MSLGLLAALTGFVEGRGEAYDSKKELLTAADKVKQSASNERLKTKFGKAIKKYDLLEKDNEDAIHSGVESSRAQWILSGRRADGVAEKDYKSTDRTSDKVYGLHILGDKPELDYLDATNFRAPQASFISSLAYQDGDKYTGGTMAQEESSRYNLSNVRAGSRQATQEQMTNVTARRELEYDLGKSLPMYQSLVKNISEMPKLEEAMLKLPEGSRDHFLRTVAKFTGVTEDDVTISQATERALSLFDKAPTDVTASTATDDSLTSNKLTSLQSTLSTLNAELGSEIRTRSDSTIKKEIKAAEASIQTERNNITARKKRNEKLTDTRNQNISSYIAKNDATARTTDDYTKFFASRMIKLGETIKGVSGSDLTTSKYRNDGYKKTGASGSFTKEGVHLSRNLDNAQLYAKGYAVEQARNDMKIPLTSLTFESYNDKIVSDLAKRTFRFTDTGIYDTEAVFSIPYPSTNFKGTGYQDNYNLDAWKSLVADYVEQAGSSANDSDAALQDTLNDLYNGLRDGSVKPPSSSPEVPDVVAESVVDVASPTPIVKAATVPLGTIRDTSKGKLIKTTKGWIPYSNTAVAPNTPSAPVVEEAQEVPAYQQIADIKLAAHNAESDIKQQASLDLQAATKQTSKDAIAEAAKASIAKLRSKLKNDLAQFTGN